MLMASPLDSRWATQWFWLRLLALIMSSFTPPHAPGHAAIASMQAICTGQARALICMGGNFALAMPDREASAVPLTQLDLAVHVATKLNRSHLLTARHSYILPVLGRKYH